MEKYARLRNKSSNNLRLKASSLYFLNDISNIDSTDGVCQSNNWRDLYTFNPLILGRGHFSKVYKVKCSSTGNTLAIKVIRRRRLGTDKIGEIMQEIEIMELTNKSSNSGFIQMLKSHTSHTEVAIVMEFASGGALYHVTQESQIGLPEVYVQIALSKVLSALSVLHRQDIVHLDIKADNILLRYPYPSTDVALTDFGLAKKLTKSKAHKEMIGTPDYIAPEVVNYEQICIKSDMWSVGVLAYFMLTNISPFTGTSKEDTLHRVTKTEFEFAGKLLDHNMLHGREFINNLLVKVPENRLSAEDCLSHIFLAGVPILECLPEKSVSTKTTVNYVDCQVQVRQNSFYNNRGMVMSQYDIDSSHHHRNMLNSEEDLLKVCSMECIDKAQTSMCDLVAEDRGDVEGEHRREIEEGLVECCYNEVDDVAEMINQIRNKRRDVEEIESDDEVTESTTNVESAECVANTCSSFTDFGDTSQSDMTSSSCDPVVDEMCKPESDLATDTSESYSVLLKDESYKENHQPRARVLDGRTEVVDSRRRSQRVSKSKSVLINASFRNSRDNIIEQDAGDLVVHSEAVHSCVTNDSAEYNTGTLRSANGTLKRRPLSKSIKRDSDKPQSFFDKWKRKSELIETTVECDTAECEQEVAISHPALHTVDSGHKKRSTMKISELFKHKKPGVSVREPWNCAVS